MKLRNLLLAATLLTAAVGGTAMAQRGPLFDPAQLPETKGKVAQYSLTPRGDVDGLILADGTEVHVPPGLSTQLAFTIKPGDAVTIHGLKAKAVPLIMAGSITNDATGATIAGGLRGPNGDAAEIEVEGRVKAQLHSRRGDVDGVLLADGTIIRLPPPEAQRLAASLAPGSTVFARGLGYAGPLGKVVGAQVLGPDKDHTQPVAGPRPPGPGFRHGHGHGPGGMGPGGMGPGGMGPGGMGPGGMGPGGMGPGGMGPGGMGPGGMGPGGMGPGPAAAPDDGPG
jgi:hypothetical protein